jgi:exonuclease SbcD
MSVNKSLKILHTADWHLGKQLLKIDFAEDMNLFFDWLINCIKENQINVLLMSGDLFDQANPSQLAMTQYYYFLKQLIPLNCKVVITGGNHDSPYVINAPKELLGILDIKVVGGVPEKISELFEVIEIGNQKIVVAAVPFLRDKDIRNALPGESYNDKIELIRTGIANYFKTVNEHYNEFHKGTPFIVMAHLFAQGAQISESEREIQIGNQAGVEAEIFGEEPYYVALGHIHKPQVVSKPTVRYSGSPIQLSFSEKDDIKQVVILELEENSFNISSIEIPQFRKLITIKGTTIDVKDKLANYNSESPLIDLVELHIVEVNENIEHIKTLEDLLSSEPEGGFQIVKGKIEFENKIVGTSSLLNEGEDIGDFQPVQLFEKRLNQDTSIEDKAELINAFKEILESMGASDANN